MSIIDTSSIYFGAIGAPGHYYWQKVGLRASRNTLEVIPWKEQEIDCVLCPNGCNQAQGAAAIAYKERHGKMWTALSIWDRTGDSRRNSCSVFVVQGIHNFDMMRIIMMRDWLSICSRIEAVGPIILLRSEPIPEGSFVPPSRIEKLSERLVKDEDGLVKMSGHKLKAMVAKKVSGRSDGCTDDSKDVA